MWKVIACAACLIDLLVIVFTGCPDAQWQSMGGFCYLLFTDTVDWNTAEQGCHNLKSYLAFPKTTAEVDNLYAYINQNVNGVDSIWVGVNDRATEGQFVCQDGSLLSTSVGFWISGSPDSNTAAEDCIEMWYQQGLNDAECFWPKAYVCQVKDSRQKYCMRSTTCVGEYILSPITVNTTVQCGVRCMQHDGCCAFYYEPVIDECELLVTTGPVYQYQTMYFDKC